MPVEIRQLVIRATVDGGGSAERPSGAKEKAPAREEIITECVEQVMAILRRERER